MDQQLFGSLRSALADRYTFERELGRGGAAVVYLARDRKHDRSAAVKVLLPYVAAAIGAERFQREIKIAAKLSDPHILPLHDSGEVAGLLYYVMPFMRGESLRDRLAHEGRVPVADAVRIAEELSQDPQPVLAACTAYAREKSELGGRRTRRAALFGRRGSPRRELLPKATRQLSCRPLQHSRADAGDRAMHVRADRPVQA